MRNNRRSYLPTGNRGFTLLELIAVIAILAGLMALVLPRFADVGTAFLRTDAGRLTSLIRYTNDAAATKKIYFRMSFDLEADEVTVELSDDATEYRVVPDPAMRGIRLSRGVGFKDIVTPGLGAVDYGTIRVVFSPGGLSEPFTVHLGSSSEVKTITYNPFSGRVKVAEGYL
jgi:prepilin-type N-terminal cleavage/methylation domain-containing protein